MRNMAGYGLVALKGVAMGAADVVPGVSGGTIAFISGIYDELIDSIKSINIANLKLLFTGRFAAFWKAVNGNFLLSLILGIGLSIFSLARVITMLLRDYPVLVFAFFFGLIVASAWFVSKDIRQWNWKTLLGMVAGIVLAVWVTSVTAAHTPEALWFVFLCGFVAICAMILPGISGAFILLLLGKYRYIMTAIGEPNLPVILLFAVGAVVGIISFSHLLSWLLKNRHDATIAVLMGFMLGSLNKVWPWKETVATFVDNHGATVPLVERNIAPNHFELLTGQDSQLTSAILLCIIGFLSIYLIETAARLLEKKRSH